MQVKRRFSLAVVEEARSFLSQGKFQEAHRVTSEALEQELTQASPTMPLLTLEMAKSLQRLGESAAAERAFQAADVLFQMAEQHAEQHVECLVHYGRLASLTGNTSEAEHTLKRAVSSAINKLGGRRNPHVLNATLALSDLFVEANDLDQGQKYAGAAAELAREMGEQERLAEALSMKGVICVQRKEYEAALLLFEEARVALGVEELSADQMTNSQRLNAYNLSKNLEHTHNRLGHKAQEEAEQRYREKFGRQLREGERVVTSMKELQPEKD